MNTTQRALCAALAAATVLALIPYGWRAYTRAHGHLHAWMDGQS